MSASDGFLSAQFVRFLAVGGFAAAANFLSRILFSLVLGYSVSIVLAFLVGMVTAYTLNRVFVFTTSRTSHLHGITYFVLVNLLGLAQTYIVSIGLAYYLFPALGLTAHRETIAHFIGVCVPVFTSYLGHKHWTFR